MAAACAAADLLRKRALGVDLVFLIEGEEEVGSTGFIDAVLAYKVLLCLFVVSTCPHHLQSQIGDIDAILLRYHCIAS